MKFVFAPDSFKGSLSALQVCQALERAARAHFPGAELVLAPVADGGEGTVQALLSATGGQLKQRAVTGPRSVPVCADYGILPDGTGVMEMAACSGLPLVPSELRDPLVTTSRGTGELIAHLLDSGATRLLIGIGGSATNDGGMGMLSALGARFYDAAGAQVPDSGEGLERVHRIELAALHPGLRQAELRVICDVTNVLLGPEGATYIYGPQKGADAPKLLRLERGMRHYADAFAAIGIDISSFPGAGAAGGLGGVLGAVLGAKLMRGIDAVLSAIGFDALIEGASLVVTGEGRIDRQSVEYNKVPAGVAQRCEGRGIPVVALVGGIGEGAEAFYRLGDTAILPIVPGPMELHQAIHDAPLLIDAAADRLFRTLKIGMGLS